MAIFTVTMMQERGCELTIEADTEEQATEAAEKIIDTIPSRMIDGDWWEVDSYQEIVDEKEAEEYKECAARNGYFFKADDYV